MKAIVGRVLWAIASAAIAVALNMQLAPTFTRAYDRAQYETKTGTASMQLDRRAAPLELPLANVHIVTTSFNYVGKRYDVHEVALRAADDVISTPRLLVFAALPNARGQDPSDVVHNPTRLRGLELPLLPSGFLGSVPSYYVVAHDQKSPVLSGVLRFDTIVPPEDGEPEGSGHRASGVLQMQIETEDGVRSVKARVQARLVWDAD